MQRPEAIVEARKLEGRVNGLYFNAIKDDGGLMALKLLFPHISLPEKHARKYRGELAVAIASAVLPSGLGPEWAVWMEGKKKRHNFIFKIQGFCGYHMPGCEDIPWGFSLKADQAYFLFKYPSDMPF